MDKVEELVAELKKKEEVFKATQDAYKRADVAYRTASAEMGAAETARDEVRIRLKKALGF